MLAPRRPEDDDPARTGGLRGGGMYREGGSRRGEMYRGVVTYRGQKKAHTVQHFRAPAAQNGQQYITLGPRMRQA